MKEIQNMRKTVFRSICTLLAIVMLSGCFCSCTKLPDIELYRDVFTKLIESSAEVNDIFFGAGLPVDENIPDGYEKVSGYKYVSDGAKYHSIFEIKKLAANVYSTNYLNYIYNVIFNGYADNTAGVLTARFIETRGLLMQTEKAEPLNGTRRFDYSTMKAVRPCSDKLINIEITTWIEGGKPYDFDENYEINEILSGKKHTYTLTFVLEDGAWRLDTPTY